MDIIIRFFFELLSLINNFLLLFFSLFSCENNQLEVLDLNIFERRIVITCITFKFSFNEDKKEFVVKCQE